MKQETPILSVHDENVEMRECVDAFVFGLADRIDDLQEAELGSDIAEVARLGRDLVEQASRCGYPALVEVAEALVIAYGAGEAGEVRKGITELTELAQRVRRGSRGAA